MRVVSDRAVLVSNVEFLQTVFGDEWEKAHVAAFLDDPADITKDRRALCWAGGAAGERLARFSQEENQYFTISLFHREENGRAVRRKAHFDACFVIVADDVKEKVPVEQAEKLPAPTYKLVSSSGSEQWGWVLDNPCEDRAAVENLLDGLVAKGLAPNGTDPGMKGVTRYVRLPEGSNTKAKRRIEGKGFKCYLSEWNPSQLASIESLASVFGIDLHADRGSVGSGMGLAVTDTIVRDHPVFKYLNVESVGNDGWIRVDCPNAETHSCEDASGAAVQIMPDGRVNFTCHHGHCQGEGGGTKLTGPRMLRLLDEKLHGGSGQLLDEIDDYQKKVYAETISKMAKDTGMFPKAGGETSGGKKQAVISGDGEPSGLKEAPPIDAMRYIFLAHENKFYDIKTGNLVTPKGLDNLFKQQMPPGRNRLQASDYLLSTMDHDLSTADGIGWVPTSIAPPARDELIFEDNGTRWVNKWKGLAVTPTYGDVSLWLGHAEYLFQDKRERDVVLDYLACVVQRLDKKPGFFIAHRGAHRIGKDLFYKPLVRAMGSHAARTVDIDNVLGGWGDYLDQLKFAILTEVDKAQDRKVANAMKTVVAPTASGKRTLNLKGRGVSVQVDCMCGVMMSNKRAFMAIEEGDRRYFVVDSWVPVKDPSYYDTLADWLDSGTGVSDVLGYLLTRDISGFNHNTLPYMTAGALEMVETGRYDYEQDLDMLIGERHPPFHTAIAPVKEVRKLCREMGLKGGNNGIDEALERLGWFKLRGAKKVEGSTAATPTFYTNSPSVNKASTPGEVFDFYQGENGGG